MMKRVKLYIKFIVALILLTISVQSCKYDKLPPKTDDASSEYILPRGEVPTAAELEIQRAAKDEYNKSINN